MKHSDCDGLAGVLGYGALMAHQMPPSWDGGKCSIMACGPNGEYFGKLLPGRGLYLAHDLKSLGITHPIPNVYERSLVGKCLDFAHKKSPDLFNKPYYNKKLLKVVQPNPEQAAIRAAALLAAVGLGAGHHGNISLPLALGAITTYDGIINARANGKGNDWSFAKASFTTVANTWWNTFRAGGTPGVGTYSNIPSGAVADRSNAGALSLGLSNPTNPDKKYLLTAGFTSTSVINMLLLLDLLVGAGNILVNNGAQTVNSTAQTRQYGDSLGAGVMAALDVTTALSATNAGTSNLSSYTNQGGTTAHATGAITNTISAGVQRVEPSAASSIAPFFPLQAGDYGIRSVETYTSASATATTGIVALNLVFPLCWIPGVASNVWIERDTTIQIDGLTELVAASFVIGCLIAYANTNGTTLGSLVGFLRSCAG